MTQTAPVPLLSAQNLVRKFGGLTATNDVSFNIGANELRCIIGPNGAGKSTFLNLLCGTLAPTSGTIRFEGRNITGWPLHRIARIGIAREFQVPSVFESLSVQDNLDVALGGAERRDDAAGAIAKMLDLLSLAAIADKCAGDLAHGQKQWLEIGMAMITRPKLLLDEPTAGIQPSIVQQIGDFLKQIVANTKISVLLVEQNVDLVFHVATRGLVMEKGRIVREAETIADLKDDAVMREFIAI